MLSKHQSVKEITKGKKMKFSYLLHDRNYSHRSTWIYLEARWHKWKKRFYFLPGIELGAPELGAWSLSHWTTRKVPHRHSLFGKWVLLVWNLDLHKNRTSMESWVLSSYFIRNSGRIILTQSGILCPIARILPPNPPTPTPFSSVSAYLGMNPVVGFLVEFDT